MFGTKQRTRKNENRMIHKFHFISLYHLLCLFMKVKLGSEKIWKEQKLSSRNSLYKASVRMYTYRPCTQYNTQCITNLGFRRQNPRLQKNKSHILILRSDLSRLIKMSRISNEMDEQMLEDEGNDGRTVLKTEHVNKSLLSSRWW